LHGTPRRRTRRRAPAHVTRTTPPVDRVAGVQAEIEQHLLDLQRVDAHQRGRRRDCVQERHARRQRGAHRRQRIVDQRSSGNERGEPRWPR